jgi:rRNA maturation endonuclease Nob1
MEKEPVICPNCENFIGEEGLDVCPICGHTLHSQVKKEGEE